jgi:hypothetical protein
VNWPVYKRLFSDFVVSGDSLQVYEGSTLIFSSTEDRLLPLMKYIDDLSPYHRQVVIFDKLVGNAGALLAVKAGCREVYSPLGSQQAVDTLEKHAVWYHLNEIVPYIKNVTQEDMCPMERLSLNKDPEEFYEAMRGILRHSA